MKSRQTNASGYSPAVMLHQCTECKAQRTSAALVEWCHDCDRVMVVARAATSEEMRRDRWLSIKIGVPDDATHVTFGEVNLLINKGQVATLLPPTDDGSLPSVVWGEAHNTEAYAKTAAENGYGADVVRMNVCHEIMHSMLAYWLGLPTSPIMQRLSRGVNEPTALTMLEEQAVQAIERFANAMNIDLQQVAQRYAHAKE